MARGRNKKKKAREIVVESDFLFGLQKTDSRHQKVTLALRFHKEGVWKIEILSSAVLEIRNVMYSRGFSSKIIEQAITLMDALLESYDVEDYVPLELDDLIVAEKLQEERPSLTFFDALHASVLKRVGSSVLTTEGVYASMGFSVIDLDQLRSSDQVATANSSSASLE